MKLKNKKRCLRKDVDAMTSSADEYAEKAEKTHQLTWIAKSNSLPAYVGQPKRKQRN